MKREKSDQLANLLRELAEERTDIIPEEVWFALHELIPMPAVEVLITRDNGKEFLLIYRKDKFWDGWHVPGGFVKIKESLIDACRRIAESEVRIDISGLKLIDVVKYEHHPYGGSPVGIFYVCSPVGEVKETETMHFFKEAPENMIPGHSQLINSYLQSRASKGI